uniref:Uncharacterized protein n=1 Tax=Glossina pallidipes TaxID=7398 RepID=A0A1A9ZDK8_GLOPL
MKKEVTILIWLVVIISKGNIILKLRKAFPIVDRCYNSSLKHQTTRKLFGLKETVDNDWNFAVELTNEKRTIVLLKIIQRKIESQLTAAAIDDKQAHRLRDLFGYTAI